ncbi:DUF6597 domain-containing transcriptional factor [Rhizobium sp. RU36D]|uniref:DUF6597 domain-containing transcriptional factor n=1 Tax=Rhizobium sp. RU36D TaxID=1907415 RepID=UPI0009D8D5E6|nr:DUF6597 domain-containing transcriptional factor [Rhizobium sp. RU36D]SMD20069.1 transcriptional regulator, AraC family [Rhizobium sp. RU36D]
MFLRTIPPHAVIAPYIHHFWVFDAPAGLPAMDARVVVPNGRAKLIVPWRNGLTARAMPTSTRKPGRHSPEGEIVLVGLWDQPTTLSSTAGRTVTIGVEFTPTGLAHFIRQDLHEIFLEIAPVDALLGKLGEKLARRVAEADTATAAVALVHAFLIDRALENGPSPDPIVQAAMRTMAASGFSIPIEHLADRMDCSRRHLQTLFLRQVGMTPKKLQSVMAFERLYRRYAGHRDLRMLREDALDHFYDQAHFIHTFRRFTGHAPSAFAELDNEFGRLFYRSPTAAAGPPKA